MAERGRPLPKFGEWDVNNPATAEGFTVIFNKARNEKKTRGKTPNIIPGGPTTADHNDPINQNHDQLKPHPNSPSPRKTKWLCCVRV